MKYLQIALISVATTLAACGGGSSSTADSQPVINQPGTNQPTSKPPIKNPSTESKCATTGTVIAAKSVRVIDGDTVEVIPLSGPSERIRLLGIDAPESNQDYGTHSTQALKQCVNDAIVSIEWTERDRYDRLLGKVIADGKDCNLNQVVQGAAWHYKQYQNGQLEYDRLAYANAEVVARSQQQGLWANNNPTAPWDFRKGLNISYEYNDATYNLSGATCNLGGVMTGANKMLDSTPTLPSPPPTTPNFPIDNGSGTSICSSMVKKTCAQMSSCVEAQQQLACGNNKIDGNKDGVPCEKICK